MIQAQDSPERSVVGAGAVGRSSTVTADKRLAVLAQPTTDSGVDTCHAPEGLAQRAEMDRTYVGDAERGERNVSLDNIGRLADALGVRPPYLLADLRQLAATTASTFTTTERPRDRAAVR